MCKIPRRHRFAGIAFGMFQHRRGIAQSDCAPEAGGGGAPVVSLFGFRAFPEVARFGTMRQTLARLKGPSFQAYMRDTVWQSRMRSNGKTCLTGGRRTKEWPLRI